MTEHDVSPSPRGSDSGGGCSPVIAASADREQPDVLVDVFWRPGCAFCSMLRGVLNELGVPARWHNIWTDESARRFVRSVNGGKETVPTVRVGDATLTNPTWRELEAHLPATYRRTATNQTKSMTPRWGRVAGWLPVTRRRRSGEIVGPED